MKRPQRFLSMLGLALTACGPGSPSGAGTSSAPHAAPAAAPSNRIDVPASVRANLGIRYQPVERRSVVNTLRVPGRFELQHDGRREHHAVLAGRVELLVAPLEEIEAGQPVYRLDSQAWRELQLRLTELEGRREALQALSLRAPERAELEGLSQQRELLLRSMSSILGTDAAEPVTEEGETRPRWRQVDRIVVRSAQAGRVDHLAVSQGARVGEGDLVLRIVQPQRVRFRGQALQSDLSKLRDGQAARIVAPYASGGTAGDLSGRLQVGLAADAQRRTIDLFVTPDDTADWARPGVLAGLEIVTASSDRPELAVPLSAVQRDGLTPVLFRRDPKDPDRVIRIEADLGRDDGRWVEVRSGLMDGDEVVLEGGFQLMLSSSGTVQKGGHFHADGTFHEGHD